MQFERKLYLIDDQIKLLIIPLIHVHERSSHENRPIKTNGGISKRTSATSRLRYIVPKPDLRMLNTVVGNCSSHPHSDG